MQQGAYCQKGRKQKWNTYHEVLNNRTEKRIRLEFKRLTKVARGTMEPFKITFKNNKETSKLRCKYWLSFIHDTCLDLSVPCSISSE